MTTEGHTTITLLGRTHTLKAPASFADREDLLSGWRAANDPPKSRRIFGATLALCVPEIAALAKGAPDPEDGLTRYGKVVYDALRKAGASPEDISTAATAAYHHIVGTLFPREDAVAKAEDFTEAGERRT